MTFQLTLPSDQQAELERRAAAGVDPVQFVQMVLQERLQEPAEPPRPRKMSYKKWKRLFEKWIASQVPHNPNFDDSRESIYP